MSTTKSLVMEQKPPSQDPDKIPEGNEAERRPETDQESNEDKKDSYTPKAKQLKRLTRQVGAARSVLKQDHAKILGLREKMGLPPDADFDESGREYLSDLERQQHDAETAVKGEEDEFLGAPEGEGEDPETERETEEKPPEDDKEQELMTEEMRKKMIEDYIKSVSDNLVKKFGDFIDGAKNKERAEELLRKKISVEVMDRAEDYIENGGQIHIGFSADLKISSFPDSNGEKVKYMTDMKLEFDDEKPLLESDSTMEDELMDKNDEEQKKKEAKNGLVETEEKKDDEV